jgi:hypothetical protein
MDIAFVKTALLTLFVAIDPPGLVPIFLALTAHMTLAERKSTAKRSVLIAFGILAASAIGGQPLRRFASRAGSCYSRLPPKWCLNGASNAKAIRRKKRWRMTTRATSPPFRSPCH